MSFTPHPSQDIWAIRTFVQAEIEHEARELTARLLKEQKHSETTCSDTHHGGECQCADSRGELDELFRVALVRARELRGESQKRRVRHFVSSEGRGLHCGSIAQPRAPNQASPI